MMIVIMWQGTGAKVDGEGQYLLQLGSQTRGIVSYDGRGIRPRNRRLYSGSLVIILNLNPVLLPSN
jgi:hypothetical protein